MILNEWKQLWLNKNKIKQVKSANLQYAYYPFWLKNVSM